ncbi:MAG: hypothetical protein AAGG01_22125 [Planctomycetota bacterium]
MQPSVLPPLEPASGLDASVSAALSAVRSAGTPSPDVLVFAATGLGGLLEQLEAGVKLDLDDVDGTPATYQGAALYAGTLSSPDVEGDGAAWLIEDAPHLDRQGAAWSRAFPVWLAAAAGASFLIHLSAGSTLDPEAHTLGSIVRSTDHINLSGTTPLLGLGKSRFGPLFPDQTRLHDAHLGDAAARLGEGLDIPLTAGIAACATGPALPTPAELRSYRLAGASVAVQRLSDPLIAAAHAGLGAIALTAITSGSTGPTTISDLVLRSSEIAPSLDALVAGLVAASAPLAQARREEATA